MPGGDTRPNEVGQDRNVTGHDGELRGSVTFGVEEWQDERMQRAGRTRQIQVRDCLRSGNQERQYDAVSRNGIHRYGVERVQVVGQPHRLRTVVLDGICDDRLVRGEGSGRQESLAWAMTFKHPTSMLAAVITKDKHKKPVSGEVDVSLAAATPAVTAAHMAIAISTSKSLEIKAVVAVERVEDASETPAPKRYRRRHCEVEGCTKFVLFNNCGSGHSGRRL
ncbi:hypothetical protein GN958_ATG19261 [Phytophthora infestans]|uniref:Uncharacterized protein n=1 Tax=Phytophthora infestans TaxID=4787 RepID=A0A8S9TSR7_PHYIN|nr:hypothetical protein GN958_ATG19261 [Phytophthora infestans]